MDKKQETIDTYNNTAGQMAEKFNTIGARVADIEMAFAHVSKTNPAVLEIGCGNGRDAKEILKRTTNYLGLDISEGMVEIAKKYVPEGSFVVADIESYSFPKNLDIIFSFASLLHSSKEHVQDVLDKAHEALNEGGIFFISLKCGEYREESRTDEFGTRTYYLYTPELIKELAGNKYKVLYENMHDLRDQKWLELILQK